jgi:citrate lyase beta subunit
MTAPPTSLPPSRVDELLQDLTRAEHAAAPDHAARLATGAAPAPVHVVYGGAHLYRADSAEKLAKIARAAMETWGRDDDAFARWMGVREVREGADAGLAAELARRVREKLSRDPVEKSCIDFEDGYGPRPDEEEDAEAVRTAGELARAAHAGGAARPVVGIRIKALASPAARRAMRTLDLFLTTLVGALGGGDSLPAGFTVTLPKVSRPGEVAALVALLETLETALGIPAGKVGIELMVETPRALVDGEGRVALPALVAAAKGRCVAAHLGAYDLTASLGVTAGEQRLDHPACDLARLLMQMSLAGSGVVVVDGATTVLPIATHRETAGAPLTDAQRAINAGDVTSAWALHAASVTRALSLGIYQGWDLHPAQLPARYGAVYAFFLAERRAMATRLRSFVAKATQATRSGQVFDDAATGQGLLEFFVRGVACGALGDEDVRATGLSLDELRARSFTRIVAARSAT